MKKSGGWRVASGETSGSNGPQSNRCFGSHNSQSFGFFLTNNLKLRTYNSLFTAQVLLIVLFIASAAGCGYHVAGRSNALPKSIHVIAVPALENKTTTYRIEQRLTAATVHEFLAKTTYRVISDPANGDAVLRGKVLSVEAVPLLRRLKQSPPKRKSLSSPKPYRTRKSMPTKLRSKRF